MSDVWTPNDYSNIITIGAAAIGSVLLIVFKSRCNMGVGSKRSKKK